MIVVYFFYGLAFFTLGISILIYPKKNSAFTLANYLSLIGLFGIIHGIHEWAITFTLVPSLAERIMMYLNYIGFVTLPISYFFLLLFGTNIVCDINNKLSSLKALPAILSATWLLLTMASRWDSLMADIWARYLLGAPGIFLTSYALFSQVPFIKKKIPHMTGNVLLAAGAFFFYGIFAGLIVPEAGFFPASILNYTAVDEKVGLPIQLFRAFCAVVLFFSMIRILNIFGLEVTEKLRELSLKDELTGLLNRRGLTTLAEHQIKFARRQKKGVLVHSVDIDYLKWINDTFGHKEGDLALREVANIFKETLRQSDIIARIGGDEFVIIQQEDIDSDLNVFTSRLQEKIDFVNAKNEKYNVSISIGSIRCESDREYSIDELIEKADKLMYEHKKSKQQSK